MKVTGPVHYPPPKRGLPHLEIKIIDDQLFVRAAKSLKSLKRKDVLSPWKDFGTYLIEHEEAIQRVDVTSAKALELKKRYAPDELKKP